MLLYVGGWRQVCTLAQRVDPLGGLSVAGEVSVDGSCSVLGVGRPWHPAMQTHPGGLSASLWAEAISHVRPHFCRRRSGPTWEKGNVRTKVFSSFPLQTPAPCLADVAGCRRMNGKVVRSIFERAPMAVVGPNAARRPYQSAIRPQVRPESWGEDAEPSPSPMPSRARARARGSARGRGRARGRARAAWWRWW